MVMTGLLKDMTDRIHEIRKAGNLFYLLNAFLGAYNRRTDVLAKPDDSAGILIAINNLERKVDSMSSNIDRIEKEVADLSEDVGAVRNAVDGLKAVVSDLKDQVSQGQLDQARLDAAATSLEQIDSDLDAITATESPVEPPVV